MRHTPQIRVLSRFFLSLSWRRLSSRWLMGLGFILPLTLLILKMVELGNPSLGLSVRHLFPGFVLVSFYQIYLPLMSIFFCGATFLEDVEQQTQVYLKVLPLPYRWVFAGKWLAYAAMTWLALLLQFSAAYAIAFGPDLMSGKSWTGLLQHSAFLLLGVLAYGAFFGFLGVIFRRAMLFSLIYLMGWEVVVQYIPGMVRLLSINHYLAALIPEIRSKSSLAQIFKFTPPDRLTAVLVLLGITLVFLLLACFLSERKEIQLRDAGE